MCDEYPSEEELEKIKNWPYMDVFNLFQFIQSRWNWSELAYKEQWSKRKPGGLQFLTIELHTGGWSGNESLVDALLENTMVKIFWYQKWVRGGHYTFEIVPYNIGYYTVQEFAKSRGISKQAVHNNKDKYEWLDIGNPILLVRC